MLYAMMHSASFLLLQLLGAMPEAEAAGPFRGSFTADVHGGRAEAAHTAMIIASGEIDDAYNEWTKSDVLGTPLLTRAGARGVRVGQKQPSSTGEQDLVGPTSDEREGEDEEFSLQVDMYAASNALIDDKTSRKPVIWAHLHKAGGTFMCDLARKQHERIVDPSITCNLEPRYDSGLLRLVDSVGELGKNRHRLSCTERSDLYRDKNFTWGQIEREYNDEDIGCHDAFLYGTMLREPMSLMSSIVNFNWFRPDRLFAWFKLAQANPQYPCDQNVPNSENPCKHRGWTTLDWKLFDNFVTRSLNGYDTWNKPFGRITSEDLEAAKRRLEAMDVVMLLENLGEDKVQLETVLGWNVKSLSVVRKTEYSSHFTEEQSAFLKKQNEFDLALYEHAQKIATQRREAIEALSKLGSAN